MMERRAVLCVALRATALLAAAGSTVAGGARPSHPNVLYMVADDLRIELPAYGAAHVYAPALSQLAQESLVFDAAYCNQPVRLCPPAGWRQS